MKQETAVTLLFEEFRALSEDTRKAGDEQSANLIDFLCEREDVAKQMEREQMVDFALNCQEMFKHQIQERYNETYKGGEQ